MAPEVKESDVSRLERLANLVLYLLHAGRPVTIRDICDQVAGYPSQDDPASLRQRFERDKRLLRDQGIVIHVEPVAEETQLGYSIREQDFFLPDLELTSEEQSALSIAVAGVHIDDLTSRMALAKLGIAASGSTALTANLPDSPKLPVLHEAMSCHATVSFSYGGVHRAVDAFGMLCQGGAWYLFGWDHARGERRTFRVDRIEDEVTVGESGAYEVPAGFDASTELPSRPWEIGGGDGFIARIRIGSQIAPVVVASVGEDHVEERFHDGSVVLVLDAVNADALRSWVLGLADHAQVLDPPELVASMVEWLDRMVDAGAANLLQPGRAREETRP